MHEITSQPLDLADYRQVRRVQGWPAINEQYQAYLRDESKLTSETCDYLFFPQNEAELAAVVREMASQGVPLTVAGARTGLVGGSVPLRGGLVSLERLNAVEALYYASYAREWRVRAGCAVTLSDLNQMAMSKRFPDLERAGDQAVLAELARYQAEPGDFFYPPDPTEMSAFLGGTVATNASGARTYRYGATRDWVRGLRVILANGELLDIPRGKYFASSNGRFTIFDSQSQGRQVLVPDYSMPRTKNTSGFYAAPHMDLVDLFIGSEGMLGIITTVDVALCPRTPKCSLVQFTGSDEQALDLVESLRGQDGLQLDFLEFYSQKAIELLRRRQAEEPVAMGMPPIPEDAGAAVFFELSFDPLAVDQDFSLLAQAVERVGLSLQNSWAGYEMRELARFKTFRHMLPETVNHLISERKRQYPGLHKLGTDLAVPDDKLRPMWKVYQEALDQAGLEWLAFGHVGNNHVHINLIPRDMEDMQRGLELYGRFAAQAVAFGGTVSAEHGIGKIKAKFLKEMFTEPQIAQMKAVKRALDPQGLLNPGNIFLS
ncbi:MAG: FAD-binding oxidoreductase [Proteobacteria bacterium]|nr:FAD-binding oxidoreductase [Pseudomonadota bacterium]MBU1452458.1 FAD-binding oxidoreductase [Pseudomonadota bacterium]MBU2467725.1 FAD-binding oxidoreductase [Pseudomonadota bacterium]MBU2518277.1 FAD-binding oxidoreductase [Pseudomonadota bacterium]